jgi:hypothetical protein
MLTIAQIAAVEPLSGRGSPQSPARGTRSTTGRALALDALVLLLAASFLCVHGTFLDLARDSTIFSYIGGVIASGGFPYVDAWDHKGPLVYLVYGLAQGVVLPPQLALSVIINAALLVASVVLHLHLRQIVGRLASLIGILVGMAGVYAFASLGLTEAIAAPLQLLSLSATFAFSRHRSPAFLACLGVLAAAVLLIRADLAALPLIMIVLCLVLSAKQADGLLWRRLAVNLVAVAGAFLLMALPVVVYLWAGDALAAMVDQYIVYNLFHISGSAGRRMLSGVSLTKTFLREPLIGAAVFIGLTLALSQLVSLVLRPTHVAAGPFSLASLCPARSDQIVLLAGLVAAFFAAYGLTILSAWGFTHYLVSLVPTSMVLAGGCFAALLNGIRTMGQGRLAVGLIAFGMVAISYGELLKSTLWSVLLPPTAAAVEKQRLIDHLKSLTDPGQPILVYGADGSLYTATGTYAPTRYFYQYPLITKNYATAARIQEFGRAIQKDRPAVIVVENNPRIGHLDTRIEGAEDDRVFDLDTLNEIHQWIKQNYRTSASFFDQRVTVYIRCETSPC